MTCPGFIPYLSLTQTLCNTVTVDVTKRSELDLTEHSPLLHHGNCHLYDVDVMQRSPCPSSTERCWPHLTGDRSSLSSVQRRQHSSAGTRPVMAARQEKRAAPSDGPAESKRTNEKKCCEWLIFPTWAFKVKRWLTPWHTNLLCGSCWSLCPSAYLI